MNRKGRIGQGIIYTILLLEIFTIIGGLLSAYYVFLGQEFDFRQVSAEMLANRVRECIETGDLFFADSDVFVNCRLNENALRDSLILVMEKDSKEVLVAEGIRDFEVRCDLNKKGADIPRCASLKAFHTGREFSILVADNQHSRKVAIS